MLCDLNDIVGEYESDYLKQPHMKRIFAAFRAVPSSPVPEVQGIVSMVEAGESNLDYEAFSQQLAAVYKRYVVARFATLLRGEA
jgi:hypothetical protein